MTNSIALGLLVVTAYVNPHHNVAANGREPVAGITVAGPRSIKLGTHVFIEGVGERIITDRLNKRYSESRIDIFMSTREEAIRFGKRTNQVWIITK